LTKKLKSSVIDDKANKTKEELKENLSSIFGGLDVGILWTTCDTKITDIITQQDYDAALLYCYLEHTEVIVGVGEPFATDYSTMF
jgi:hypothetical protein